VINIDLGLTGKNVPIGVIEAVNKLDTYTSTCEVKSMSCELIRIKIDVVLKAIQGSSSVMSVLKKMVDEMQNNLTRRILH